MVLNQKLFEVGIENIRVFMFLIFFFTCDLWQSNIFAIWIRSFVNWRVAVGNQEAFVLFLLSTKETSKYEPPTFQKRGGSFYPDTTLVIFHKLIIPNVAKVRLEAARYSIGCNLFGGNKTFRLSIAHQIWKLNDAGQALHSKFGILNETLCSTRYSREIFLITYFM